LEKYTIFSKFSKTNISPLWLMAAGANRYGQRRLQMLQRQIAVGRGGCMAVRVSLFSKNLNFFLLIWMEINFI
jgi:hypothetical protein